MSQIATCTIDEWQLFQRYKNITFDRLGMLAICLVWYQVSKSPLHLWSIFGNTWDGWDVTDHLGFYNSWAYGRSDYNPYNMVGSGDGKVQPGGLRNHYDMCTCIIIL